MAAVSATTPKVETKENITISTEELQILVEKMVNERLPKVEKNEEQPHNIVNDVKKPLERPKPIRFQIRPLPLDNSEYDGKKIPGMSFVGGYKITDVLAMDEYNNYITGFEFESLEYYTGLKDQELTDYQNEVKKVRLWIERQIGQSLSASNKPFWSSKILKIDNLDTYYDTSIIENLILYYNIMGGGFTQIATSIDDAKKNSRQLYITVAEDESRRNFSHRKATMKANSMLDEIMDTWKAADVLYLLYYLPVKKKHGYTLNSPREILVGEMIDFIEGIDTLTEKKARPQMFIDAVNRMKSPTNSEQVKVEGLFNAAVYYGFITMNKVNKVYESKSRGTVYGGSIKYAVEYLSDAKNVDDFAWLKGKVNDKWIS